ncbi:ankyrin repeat domain-containing protein [Wolbachia endosymbiont (group A) of Conops quadrifasciatus]|uniref:ankyrin repeat domain-containing protein n=1 Tax=Wolbachia endosymbiont (group A) of Conops quadrifasciatus TaxID=3066143 RepID=UPI00313324C4
MREIDQELFDAADQGNLNEVKKCLNRGADVLARNSHHTVLHSAVSGNNEEVIKLVLNKIKETQRDVSQYIDAKDTEGDTPLMWATENGYVNATQILLDYGTDTEVRNNDGMKALYWAAKKSEEGVAKLLIDKGADVYAEDKDGKKPLDIARELWPHFRVTQLLYENDYSLNEVATYAGEVAVGTTLVAGGLAAGVVLGAVGFMVDATLQTVQLVGDVVVGAG